MLVQEFPPLLGAILPCLHISHVQTHGWDLCSDGGLWGGPNGLKYISRETYTVGWNRLNHCQLVVGWLRRKNIIILVAHIKTVAHWQWWARFVSSKRLVNYFYTMLLCLQFLSLIVIPALKSSKRARLQSRADTSYTSIGASTDTPHLNSLSRGNDWMCGIHPCSHLI